ncbi:hypothetical protein BJ878DRAFT_426173 [Calycina marina]|uniref:Uncharacterized protein n=1 Tax=Calycina marina TaxID=1763456 RepID=A0A9P7YZ09_9HELO|nr:hypothetical protein BJ878DRAFT_426173 [Calycina marina]
MPGPTNPDTTNHTESVAANSSSKTESNASSHPLHQGDKDEKKGEEVEFRHHTANPGPQITQVDVPQEGTKEERRMKAQELNK